MLFLYKYTRISSHHSAFIECDESRSRHHLVGCYSILFLYLLYMRPMDFVFTGPWWKTSMKTVIWTFSATIFRIYLLVLNQIKMDEAFFPSLSLSLYLLYIYLRMYSYMCVLCTHVSLFHRTQNDGNMNAINVCQFKAKMASHYNFVYPWCHRWQSKLILIESTQ